MSTFSTPPLKIRPGMVPRLRGAGRDEASQAGVAARRRLDNDRQDGSRRSSMSGASGRQRLLSCSAAVSRAPSFPDWYAELSVVASRWLKRASFYSG